MSGVESKNYYTLLGVERNATKEQIRDAYKEIARIYHPDSHYYDEILESAGVQPAESETFKLITEAYNTLSNEAARKAYDSRIPGELPEWEDDRKDDWHVLTPKQTQRQQNSRANHPAMGSFGVMKKKTSAFDDAALRNLRPVSEMIKRRTFWWRIKWLFFLAR